MKEVLLTAIIETSGVTFLTVSQDLTMLMYVCSIGFDVEAGGVHFLLIYRCDLECD